MLIARRLALAASLVSAAFALPKVTRQGKYLYSDDGTRFFFKGIAYQQQGTVAVDPNNGFPEPSNFIDPLADANGCNRDLPLLKQLGVNAVRVYSVDSSKNHDGCMQALSGAGIYTIIDLSLPVNGSIDRSQPSWTTNLLDQYITTINTFLKYDNVIAFNVANEVIAQPDQNPTVTAAAPFIKAAARDIKAYLKSKNSSILVSYSSTDMPSNFRSDTLDILQCDTDATSIDLFGLNNYEWCGDSNFQSSYAGTNAEFQANAQLPVYFSEFGCNTSPPRLFTEVQALFGPDMNQVWSGGIAFSYFPATVDGFGMVTLSSDNKTVTPNDDFGRLQAQYSNVTLATTPSKSDAGQNTFPACPQPNGTTWLASTTLPPTPNDQACQCLDATFSCVFRETNSPGEPAVIGELTGAACSLLAQQSGSCSPLGANGTTGQYGTLSFCDPVTKLNYAFSAFYDATSRNPQSCNFAGNATLNPTAPSSPADAAAASSCLSNAQATFVPTAPAGSSGNSGVGPSGPSGSSGQKGNAAISLFGTQENWLSVTFAILFAVGGGVWTVLL